MNPIDEVLERAKKEIDAMIEDLRVCHEYYCRNNCATILPRGSHSLRCKRLVETWGFRQWEDEKP